MTLVVVTTEHIRTLIHAGLTMPEGIHLTWIVETPRGPEQHTLTPHTAASMGQVLLDTNLAALNSRYEVSEQYVYAHAAPRAPCTPVGLLRALDGYEHQASEAPLWDTSTARAFCERLRDEAITHLAGYDEAPWLIPDLA